MQRLNPCIFQRMEAVGIDLRIRQLSYEDVKKRAEPYTKIIEELPDMRRESVNLVKKAIAENRRAYVIVNNRSEGNAPLTIQALSDQFRDA